MPQHDSSDPAHSQPVCGQRYQFQSQPEVAIGGYALEPFITRRLPLRSGFSEWAVPEVTQWEGRISGARKDPLLASGDRRASRPSFRGHAAAAAAAALRHGRQRLQVSRPLALWLGWARRLREVNRRSDAGSSSGTLLGYPLRLHPPRVRGKLVVGDGTGRARRSCKLGFFRAFPKHRTSSKEGGGRFPPDALLASVARGGVEVGKGD